MVIKCQRSLFTTQEFPRLLLYNRSRTRIIECDITPDWNERFGPSADRPDDNKFFAIVLWNKRNKMPQFVRKMPDNFDW